MPTTTAPEPERGRPASPEGRAAAGIGPHPTSSGAGDARPSAAGDARPSGRDAGGPSAGREAAPSADLILLTAITLWAINYSAVKFGVSQLAPLAFPVIRFGLSGLALLVVLRLREGSIGVRRSDLPLLALTGLLGITLSQIFFVFALTNTGATDMALLGATGPIATALLATAVGIERLGRRHWLALAISLAGTLLIVGGSPSAALGTTGLIGDGLALGNVLVSSASAIPIVPLLRRYSPLRILTYEMLLGVAILLPISTPALLGQDYRAVSAAGWASLAFAAIGGGIATNLLYFTGIGRVGPSRAAIFQYLQSFLGVIFAVLLLGERVTLVQLAGGVVVIAGVTLSRVRPARSRVIRAMRDLAPGRSPEGAPATAPPTLEGDRDRGT